MQRKRLERLRSMMKKRDIPAILITKPENRFYLSGFTGSTAFLLITQSEARLLTDFRYIEQATKEAPLFEVVKGEKPLINKLKEMVQGLKSLALEAHDVSYASFGEYEKAFEGVELLPLENLIEEMRIIKDKEEMTHLREAVKRADNAFAHILSYIKPGVKERDVALELEFFMKREGGKVMPFGIIVASGERGSLPHGIATDKEIEKGDLITMDFGSWCNHYLSDLTRTVALGSITTKQKEIYQLVKEAQLKAIEEIRPGLKGRQIDRVARKVIEDRSLEEYFGHGLGHGVGLEIHESPRLSKESEEVLKDGMIVTIEPGIYIPGFGGVRIEDMILITRQGGEILTGANKELIIL